jgi:hypothetical protein
MNNINELRKDRDIYKQAHDGLVNEKANIETIKNYRKLITEIDKEIYLIENPSEAVPEIPQKTIEFKLFGIPIFRYKKAIDEAAFYRRMSGLFEIEFKDRVKKEKVNS